MKMERSKDMGNSSGLIQVATLESLMITILVVMVNTPGRMGVATSEIGSRIRCMVKVDLFGPMEKHIKVNT